MRDILHGLVLRAAPNRVFEVVATPCREVSLRIMRASSSTGSRFPEKIAPASGAAGRREGVTMRRRWISTSGLALAAGLAIAHAGAPAPLAPLDFLVGAWVAGDNSGAHGPGTGSCAFERGLQDHVIVRTNHAEYPAANGAPARKHDDLMVIYPASGGAIEASYFDNEDHAIHYAVTSPAPNEATFVSDVAAGTPRFRLTYSLRPDGVVLGEFFIAPPGQPEGFKSYLTWELRRAQAR